MNKFDEQPVVIDENVFMQAIMSLGKHIMLHMEANLESVDVSLPKLHALKELTDAGEPLGVTQLARCIRSGRSNATQLVDRLESEGLVERVRNPEDRRGVLVRLTEAGAERFEAGDAIRRQIVREMMARLSDDERRVFLSMVQRLTDGD